MKSALLKAKAPVRSGHKSEQHFAAGLAAMRGSNLLAAELSYRACLGLDPRHAAAHHHLALVVAKHGRYEEAADLLRRTVALDPSNSAANGTLVTVLRHLGQLDEAVAVAERAVALTRAAPASHLALGTALLQAGDNAKAAEVLARAAADDPLSAEAAFKQGEALRRLGRLPEAETSCRRGLALDPANPDGLNLRGLLLDRAGAYDDALAAFTGALRDAPQDAVVCGNIAHVHLQQQNFDDAVHFARKALAIDETNSAALSNLGLTYQRQGRTKEAIEAFSKAIAVDPNGRRHYVNLSSLLIAMAEPDTAIAACRLAIRLAPDDPEAHFNLAVALRQKKLIPEAIAAYREALSHGCDEAIVDICHLRQQTCDWSGLAEEQAYAQARTFRAGLAVAPFSVMTASDNAADHRLCSEVQAARFHQPNVPLAPYLPSEEKDGSRIRVGYLSCDLFDHATTSLMVQLIERHDRSRFESFAYSFGPNDGSAMRSRVIAAFDHFADIRDVAHLEAARQIRADGIDILIDLKGYTQGCRPEILAFRPAPIQVNYLGYPGTMGAPFIDYIIGDRHVTPMAHAWQFSENIVQLPGCYQPNDRLRPVAADIGTRADFGLPSEGLVFCSFNNTYKLTPVLFGVWMRLLAAAPGSVLWLLEANEQVAANLRREAAGHGIDPARLVFAPRIKMDRHVARMALADLFLDTLPINAHTTASEALWVGLPVLTCTGEAFAGRVAASLLHAVGLPELVTSSIDDYEALALALARDPARLAALRNTLNANRTTSALFDIDSYTRGYEAALEQMQAMRNAGQPPAAFGVA